MKSKKKTKHKRSENFNWGHVSKSDELLTDANAKIKILVKRHIYPIKSQIYKGGRTNKFQATKFGKHKSAHKEAADKANR